MILRISLLAVSVQLRRRMKLHSFLKRCVADYARLSWLNLLRVQSSTKCVKDHPTIDIRDAVSVLTQRSRNAGLVPIDLGYSSAA